MSNSSQEAGEDPVAKLASRLRELQVHAGKPSVARLVVLTGKQGPKWGMPRSTIQDKLAGTTAPTNRQVLALVRACVAYAVEEEIALSTEDTNEEEWLRAWAEMQKARQTPRRQLYGAARAAAALSADGGTSREPEAAPQPVPADDEAARQAGHLIHALANFHSNPEGVYYIGQTLLEFRTFHDRFCGSSRRLMI